MLDRSFVTKIIVPKIYFYCLLPLRILGSRTCYPDLLIRMPAPSNPAFIKSIIERCYFLFYSRKYESPFEDETRGDGI